MKIIDIPRSGSQAATTSSRNRFGQYTRNRRSPVNRNTAAQNTVRARLTANSAAWRALTDAQRAGWSSLGGGMSRTDSLGQTYHLNGLLAFCSVNNNNAAAGVATVSDAPLLLTPGTITTLTLTLTSAAMSLAYTATPLGAGEKLFIYASPQRSAGRSFEADLRLIAVTAAAAASPANILAAYTARFGAPVTGNRIFLVAERFVGGFRSQPVMVSQVVA